MNVQVVKNIDQGTNGISEKLSRAIRRERRKIKDLSLQFSTNTYFVYNVTPVFGNKIIKESEMEDYLLNIDDSIKYANQKFIQKHTATTQNVHQTLILKCTVDEEGYIEDEESQITIKYSTKKTSDKRPMNWFGLLNEIGDTKNKVLEMKVAITGNAIAYLELTINPSGETTPLEAVWMEEIIGRTYHHARFYHTCHLTYQNIGSQFELIEFTPSLAGEM